VAIESVFYFSWLWQQSNARRPACVAVRGNGQNQNMVSKASRVELSPNGGIHRIIPQVNRPNFTQNSRSVEVVGHQWDFGFWGDFGAPSLAHLSYFASTKES
jgi:hypothetical protein